MRGPTGVRRKGITGTAGGSVTGKPKVKCKNRPHHRALCMTYQEFLNVSSWQVGPLEVVSSVHFALWKFYPDDTIESRLQGRAAGAGHQVFHCQDERPADSNSEDDKYFRGRFHGIGDQFIVWSEGEEELGMTWDSGLGDWVESGTTN